MTHMCNGVPNCSYLQTFADILSQYKSVDITVLSCMNKTIVTQHIKEALDCYHHLIYEHDKHYERFHDQEFEYIVKYLGYCDLHKCRKFQRNYRNRNVLQCDSDLDFNFNEMDRVYISIFDKMHCYFYHSFDIKYRRTHNNAVSLQNNANYSKINKQWIAPSKFNQFSCYNYGYKFLYDEREELHVLQQADLDQGVRVREKYENLKQEVTENSISHLSMQQFNHEYGKAQIHFYTNYRKEKCPKLVLEQLLVVMFYCNYDNFQHEFSETFRLEYGRERGNFFWMGLNLREAVCNTEMTNISIQSFYHGIGEELICPYKQRIDIFCPLSTSSSMEVALNFTNNNNGLVLEFGTYPWTAYFSCSWLSDFGNESEYLWFQRVEWSGCLFLRNVLNPKTGTGYEIIFRALDFIDKILYGCRNNLNVTTRDMIEGMCPEFEDKIDDDTMNMCMKHFEEEKK
eukprot:293970_1